MRTLLILMVFFGGDIDVTTIEMRDNSTCEAAGKKITLDIDGDPETEGYQHNVFYSCVEQ